MAHDLAYTAVFEEVEGGWTHARIAEVPGVITAGQSREEARALLQDALREYLAVFVTNDEADFDALYRQVDLHTGLLIRPQAGGREALWPLLDAALDYIEQQANDEDESPAEWMLNKRVVIDPDSSIKHADVRVLPCHARG